MKNKPRPFYTYEQLPPELQAQAIRDFNIDVPDVLVYHVVDGKVIHALSIIEALVDAMNSIDQLLIQSMFNMLLR